MKTLVIIVLTISILIIIPSFLTIYQKYFVRSKPKIITKEESNRKILKKIGTKDIEKYLREEKLKRLK